MLQFFHHPQALLVMAEAFRKERIQSALSDMPIGRVTQIMPEGDRFRQVFIQPKRARQRSCHLGNFQGVSQTRPVMIPFR